MSSNSGKTLAIAATFTAEPLNETLRFWFDRLSFPCTVTYAPFNQVFQTLLDPAGLFAGNLNGANVVLFRWQDLGHADQLEVNAKSFIESISKSASQMTSPLIVVACPSSADFLSNAKTPSLLLRLDAELPNALGGIANVHLLETRTVLDFYPVVTILDPVAERLGEVPYTADFFAAIATVIARTTLAIVRQPYKVAVVDLDNTLWGGVVGEDGWEGLRIGRSHLELQKFLLKQRADGMLLAVCSKNNEGDAWEVFNRRSDMVLHQEHFSAARVNWESKSRNVREIANELSLGSDSFLFLDDDDKECAEMRANAPEVTTIQVPKQSPDISVFLRHLWVFDRAKVTTEDKKRSESYENEKVRTAELSKAGSLQDFLSALDLKVTIEPMRPEQLSRVAQLTQRTNQFNTTTIRRTEAELKNALDSGGVECITVDVTDRFGDYGNVGAVLYHLENNLLVVDSFMLSCRALGRGVEHAIVRYLGKEAAGHHASNLSIQFMASPKNSPALRFLDTLESTHESGGSFTRSFRLTTEYASRLTYSPAAGDEIPVDEAKASGKTVTPSSTDFRPNFDWAALALQLNSVAAIRAEMKQAAAPKLGRQPPPGSTGPMNEVERKLAAIWAEVLRRPSVGVNDDFFELGGSSLRAVELLVRIVETFDRPDLTLSAILEAPTVARFAAALGNLRQVRCLVPLRETGSRPPFFCIPGVGGNVLSFRFLAANLPADQPFWGLQAPGLDGSEAIDDAKKIATLYIDEIQTVQPHGPYFLGGGCLGGVFAFEMAQQLKAQGEEVALLVLMDAYNPAFGQMISRPHFYACHARFFAQRLGNKVLRSGRFSRDAASGSAQPDERTPATAADLRAKGSGVIGEHDPVRILQRVQEANLRAGKKYVPAPYYGRIVVFSAANRMAEPYQDRFLGWRPVAKGGIEVEVIPGHHAAFDRRIRAEILDRYLREAQQKSLRPEHLDSPVNQAV